MRSECLNTWRTARVYGTSIEHHLHFAAPDRLLTDARAQQPDPSECGRETTEMVEAGIRQLWARIHVQLEQEIKRKGQFLHYAVSSPSDSVTLHPLADLFIPTPTRFLWGSNQLCCSYYTKTIHSHFLYCL